MNPGAIRRLAFRDRFAMKGDPVTDTENMPDDYFIRRVYSVVAGAQPLWKR